MGVVITEHEATTIIESLRSELALANAKIEFQSKTMEQWRDATGVLTLYKKQKEETSAIKTDLKFCNQQLDEVTRAYGAAKAANERLEQMLSEISSSRNLCRIELDKLRRQCERLKKSKPKPKPTAKRKTR